MNPTRNPVYLMLTGLVILLVCAAGPAQAVDYLAVVNHAGFSVFILDPATPHTILDNTSMVNLPDYPLGASFGPDGNLYVTLILRMEVKKYQSGTWADLGVYCSIPHNEPPALPASVLTDIAFGKNGHLYLGTDPKYAFEFDGVDIWLLRDLNFYVIRGVTVGPAGHICFASQAGFSPDPGDGAISRYNPITQRWSEVTWGMPGDLGGLTYGPDITGDGCSDLYGSDWGRGGILVVDGRTDANLGTFVADDRGTADLVFSADGTTLYFSNQITHNVYQYKNGVKTVLADASDGLNQPFGLALSNPYVPVNGNRDYLAVVNHSNKGVYIFDPALTHELLDDKTISTGLPMFATFGPNNNLFVGDYTNMEVKEFEKGTWTDKGTYCSLPYNTPPDLPAVGLTGLKFGNDGHLYMGADPKYSFVYDGVNTTLIRDMVVYVIRGVAVGPDGIVYFASQDGATSSPHDGIILRYNPTTGQWLDDWTVPGDPCGLALGPDASGDGRSDLYIANYGDITVPEDGGGILIKDSSNGADLGTFVTDDCGTADLVFSADGSTLYFSNQSAWKVYQYKNGVKTLYADPPGDGLNGPVGLALTNAYVPQAPPVTPVDTIDQAKLLPDGTTISITGKIATTSDSDLPGFFYIEEPDRSSGIRVKPSVSGVARGKVVDVQGTMGRTPAGERVIEDAVVTLHDPGDELKPLGTTNRNLGGGDFGTPPNGQYGVAGGTGMNNVGLLVKVWGEITGTDGDFLLIDDGSGVTVRVDTTSLSNPPTTGYIDAAGISSLYKPAADRLRLLLAIAVQQL